MGCARLAVFGMCLVGVSGCLGIEHHVRGVVLHTQAEGCSDVAPRTAVSGAAVRLECPGEEAVEVVTVMGGRFRLDPRHLEVDCAIVVTKDGYGERRYPVPEVCVDPVEAGGDCEAASVTAHLVPTRAPEPGPSEAAP